MKRKKMFFLLNTIMLFSLTSIRAMEEGNFENPNSQDIPFNMTAQSAATHVALSNALGKMSNEQVNKYNQNMNSLVGGKRSFYQELIAGGWIQFNRGAGEAFGKVATETLVHYASKYVDRIVDPSADFIFGSPVDKILAIEKFKKNQRVQDQSNFEHDLLVCKKNKNLYEEALSRTDISKNQRKSLNNLLAETNAEIKLKEDLLKRFRDADLEYAYYCHNLGKELQKESIFRRIYNIKVTKSIDSFLKYCFPSAYKEIPVPEKAEKA